MVGRVRDVLGHATFSDQGTENEGGSGRKEQMNITGLTGEVQGRMNAAMAVVRYIRKANPSEQARSSSGGRPRLTMGLLRCNAMRSLAAEAEDAREASRFRKMVLQIEGLGQGLDVVA